MFLAVVKCVLNLILRRMMHVVDAVLVKIQTWWMKAFIFNIRLIMARRGSISTILARFRSTQQERILFTVGKTIVSIFHLPLGQQPLGSDGINLMLLVQPMITGVSTMFLSSRRIVDTGTTGAICHQQQIHKLKPFHLFQLQRIT